MAHMKSSLGVNLLIAPLLLLSACERAEEPEQAPLVRPAKLYEVTVASNVRSYDFPAIVEASTSKDLTFQVAGQIQTLRVLEGQEVSKGEIIATLDQRRFKNDLQAAQNQYDAARQEFERAERLIKENAIAQNVFDQRKTQLNVALAQLDTSRKSLEDTTLLSPFDGVVAVLQAKELVSVTPTQTVVTLQTTGAAEAVVRVPSSLVAQSKRLQPIEAYVVLDSAPQFKMVAEMVEFSTVADERSQTFRANFAFTPPESLLILPGMTGIVKTRTAVTEKDKLSTQISIPLNAVLSDGSGQYVWLVDPGAMTVTRTDIVVGTGVGEYLQVEKGLRVGDLVVAAGASHLHEGMQIRRLNN